jgi:GNAT superfamily N-acetyltransferase
MHRHFLVDKAVLEHIDMFQLSRDYEALLERLTDQEISVNSDEFFRLFDVETEFFCFAVAAGQLVGTVQASLNQPLNHALVLVSNVVVHDDHEGQGCGRELLRRLEETAVERWSVPYGNRPLRAILTNHTKRGNSAFYTRQGWEPLTPEASGMTRLWRKAIC